MNFGKDDEEELRAAAKKMAENENDVCVCGDKTYKVGESWKEKGKCEIRACHPGGVVSIMGCPRFLYDKKNPRAGCFVVPEDAELEEYPDCCEYVYCTKGAQR